MIGRCEHQLDVELDALDTALDVSTIASRLSSGRCDVRQLSHLTEHPQTGGARHGHMDGCYPPVDTALVSCACGACVDRLPLDAIKRGQTWACNRVKCWVPPNANVRDDPQVTMTKDVSGFGKMGDTITVTEHNAGLLLSLRYATRCQ